MRDAWFCLRIQPEPWRTPPHGVGRKGGKLFVTSGSDEQLVTYQSAVKELMWQQTAREQSAKWVADKYPVKLTFYYWRQLGKGIQQADATNLNKALEDALQGILYENDRLVQDVRGVIVQQKVELDCEPQVVIHLEDALTDFGLEDMPQAMLNAIELGSKAQSMDDDLAWPPRA